VSGGRFEWAATRFEHCDETTGACLVVREMDNGTWHWKVEGAGLLFSDGSGLAASCSAAKGAARRALETHKKTVLDRSLAAGSPS